MEVQSLATSSSRILYDVPCAVCRDHSSGKHYGVYACDGCAGFFKRSVRRERRYACKARAPGRCLVDKAHRNQCRACRLEKCLHAGMNRDAVQHERGPRNSTIRRQMALFLKEPESPSHADLLQPNPAPTALDLALPKPSLIPPPTALSLFHAPYFSYSHFSVLNPNFATSPPKIPAPPPLPTLAPPADAESICEAAARLLFMNVKWAKNVPAFAALSLSDRLLLLEKSWRDLFVLGAAQFLHPIDLRVLTNGKNSTKADDFESATSEVARLRLDSHEYSCLRAIALFKTSWQGNDSSPNHTSGDCRRLQDLPAVAALQSHSQMVLNEYITRNHPGEGGRFGRLLQLLPAARRVAGATIEELFFRSTIGEISIERIISDMYRTGNEEMLA